MLEEYYKNPNIEISFSHATSKPTTNPEFHLHDKFEIYFFIAGNVTYFIENRNYVMKHGDLLIMNSSEIHRPVFHTDETYERIIIHFNPSLIHELNPPDHNLLDFFVNREKGDRNKINLNSSQIIDLLDFYKKFEALNDISDNSASAVLRLAYFLELLVLLNKAYKSSNAGDDRVHISEKLLPILNFIDQNPEENLSLGALEKKFYINRYYLSRLFKKFTGSTIHEYIIFKRISKAKKLLSQNINVTEVFLNCGFNDYSNFYRTFKEKVGVSPSHYKRYKRLLSEHN